MINKIVVGFLLSPDKSWMGGVNYFSNLIGAVTKNCADDIRSICFFGKKIDSSYVEKIAGGNEIVRTSLLDRYSLLWLLWKFTKVLTRSDWFVHFVLRKHAVQVFSHSGLRAGRFFKSCNWIPDFQHVYLPQFFTSAELAYRQKAFLEISSYSSLVFFSSNAALTDFKNNFSSEVKTSVLQFVSLPPKTEAREVVSAAELRSLYGIGSFFFYLPNQFWQHKNHLVAFRALSLLIKSGVDVELVCTGDVRDYRKPEYYQSVISAIDSLGISSNVKILGLVPYEHVYGLMQASTAVINPSLFEGWSSTVEECKTSGRPMLLSDIPVHHEQYEEASFFDPQDAASLADLMRTYCTGKSLDSVRIDRYENVEERSRNFALIYRDAIRELFE